jgi:hypothetical protein
MGVHPYTILKGESVTIFRAKTDKRSTDPREEVDIGLKSVLPEFTKCLATSDQSSRESQVI